MSACSGCRRGLSGDEAGPGDDRFATHAKTIGRPAASELNRIGPGARPGCPVPVGVPVHAAHRSPEAISKTCLTITRMGDAPHRPGLYRRAISETRPPPSPPGQRRGGLLLGAGGGPAPGPARPSSGSDGLPATHPRPHPRERGDVQVDQRQDAPPATPAAVLPAMPATTTGAAIPGVDRPGEVHLLADLRPGEVPDHRGRGLHEARRCSMRIASSEVRHPRPRSSLRWCRANRATRTPFLLRPPRRASGRTTPVPRRQVRPGDTGFHPIRRYICARSAALSPIRPVLRLVDRTRQRSGFARHRARHGHAGPAARTGQR